MTMDVRSKLSAPFMIAAVMPLAMSQSSIPLYAATPEKSEIVASKSVGEEFNVVEATIEDIQNAIKSKRITTTGLVNLYLNRIKAYNGVCVNQPEGLDLLPPLRSQGRLTR
jgi:hypothetical protein